MAIRPARGQSDAAGVDTQIVTETGFNSLQRALWRRYASSRAGGLPEVQLAELMFVKEDAAGVLRATVGGLLPGAERPQRRLPNAYIQAVRYDSRRMEGSRQLTSPERAGAAN